MQFELLADYPAELRSMIEAEYRSREDLQQAIPDMDSFGYFQWVNVDAFMHYENYRDALPPVPPEERMNVVSVGGLGGFLLGGLTAFAAVHRAVARQDRSMKDFRSILDFGCGCGRTLRYWWPYRGTVELKGCDVDGDAIEWVDQALDYVEVHQSPLRPPLKYAEDSFDLIYSISIFSHLSEENHLEWLADLARVLAPNGLAVVTTHGYRAMARLADDDEARGASGISAEQIVQARSDFEERGFAFARQDFLTNPDLYGMTFVSDEYIQSHWTRYFDVLHIERGGLDDWQDVVTLRRR